MRTPSQQAAGKDYADRRSQKKSTRIATVMKWLRNHPYSSSTEIFKATGVGIVGSCADRFCTSTKDDELPGHKLWCVNEIKWRSFLRNPTRRL